MNAPRGSGEPAERTRRGNALRRAFAWAFRSRETGRIVVGQWPNAPLILFLVAWSAAWLAGPDGMIGPGLMALSRIALGLWAADELLRGVNPWRRGLGSAVLVHLAWSLLYD